MGFHTDHALVCWMQVAQYFFHSELLMTILQSNNMEQLPVLKRCFTSRQLWSLGAVRWHVFGNPCCAILINCLHCGSLYPAAQMRSGKVMAILSLPPNVAVKDVDSTMLLISPDSGMSDWESWAGNTLRRACNISTGLQEIASEPRYDFFSFSLNSHGFWILLGYLAPNNLLSGSWSVTTMMLGKLMTNIHFSNAHAITAASPSIGAYLCSALVQNLLLWNIWCQPSGQQTRPFSIVHRQCFCRSKKSIPSLLSHSVLVKCCNALLN